MQSGKQRRALDLTILPQLSISKFTILGIRGLHRIPPLLLSRYQANELWIIVAVGLGLASRSTQRGPIKKGAAHSLETRDLVHALKLPWNEARKRPLPRSHLNPELLDHSPRSSRVNVGRR